VNVATDPKPCLVTEVEIRRCEFRQSELSTREGNPDLTGSTAPVRQPKLRPVVWKVKNWTRDTLSLTWRSQLFNIAFTTPS
jgi:hypothetical protein